MSKPKYLFWRNLLWIVLLPGTVVLLIPYSLFGWHSVSLAIGLPHILALMFVLTGLIILLSCVYDFVVKGRGTLSPVDPTKHLVITRFYKYSRNPMYLGVMLILIGQSLGYWSLPRLFYTGIVFAVFSLFIRIHEEPYLTKTFGNEYNEYKSKVRRWL